MIRTRLEGARRLVLDQADASSPAYRAGADFVADVALLVECLRQDHGLAPDSPPQAWLDLARTFGLHMTCLDVRQDARAYADILGAILAAGNVEGVARVEAMAMSKPDSGEESLFVLVKEGDTLWGIAERELGSGPRYTEIFAANREVIVNPDLIFPGQKIRIPKG
jgi:nucleoid-associated protein YgaU